MTTRTSAARGTADEAAAGTRAGVRGGTRARILSTCRDLFNERGPDGATTAEIAAGVGINEGNLYYHFRRKEQILEALFEAFEAILRGAAASYEAPMDDRARFGAYLTNWFTVMWEWRFFYRDGAAIFRLAPALRPRLKTVSDEGQAHVRRALGSMRDAGLIRATPEEIESVIVNAWIVSSYWIDYLRSRRGIADVRREHIDWGAAQVASLFRPYLTPAGLALADGSGSAAS